MLKKRSGQGVVEFALVLPIFIFIILGIYDFSRSFHVWSTLNLQCAQAARAGTKRINQMVARNFFGAYTHTPESEVNSTFWQYRSPMMSQNDYSDVTFGGVGSNSTTVEVYAKFTIDLVTPGAARLIGESPTRPGAITLAARAEERKE